MKNSSAILAIALFGLFAGWHIGFPTQPNQLQLADWHIGFPPTHLADWHIGFPTTPPKLVV